MRVLSKADLIGGMVDHPYDSNPGLLARVNFFYLSPDRRLAMAYYESPPGWFDVEIRGFSEIDYVLEGEVDLVSDGQIMTARGGDCFLIEDGDTFRWRMTKASKMIFFIYPLTRQLEDLIAGFYGGRFPGDHDPHEEAQTPG